jgi:hypothetical protein
LVRIARASASLPAASDRLDSASNQAGVVDRSRVTFPPR